MIRFWKSQIPANAHTQPKHRISGRRVVEDTLALHHDQHNFNRFFFSRRRVIFPYRTCGVIFHHNHLSIVDECRTNELPRAIPCAARLSECEHSVSEGASETGRYTVDGECTPVEHRSPPQRGLASRKIYLHDGLRCVEPGGMRRHAANPHHGSQAVSMISSLSESSTLFVWRLFSRSRSLRKCDPGWEGASGRRDPRAELRAARFHTPSREPLRGVNHLSHQLVRGSWAASQRLLRLCDALWL